MEHVVVAPSPGASSERPRPRRRPGRRAARCSPSSNPDTPLRYAQRRRSRRIQWPTTNRRRRRHPSRCRRPRGAARAPPRDAPAAQCRGRSAARRTSAAIDDRPDRDRGRPHRTGDGPAARLTPRPDDRARPDLRGRPARRAPERGVADPDRDQARFIELLADAGLREIEATSFVVADARSPSSPTPTTCSAALAAATRGVRYPVLVPNERGMARAEAAGADALAVFTAATDAFTERNIGMTVDESLAAFAPVLARAARARLVAPRLRLDRVRLPVHRRGRARAGGRGRAPAARPRRRRGLLRRHDRGRRAGAGRGADRRWPIDGRDPARADRLPLPRHARHGPRQRRGRPRRRRPLLRRLDRRDRRLPVRAGRGRQPRDGGPRLPPRRVGLRARRVARGRPRRRRGSSPTPSARPLASKVGQAGGWDPATGAAIGRG